MTVNKKQHIVIVTSAQPSANPRGVKEATALDAAGYKVTVIYVPLSPWADEFDKQLFEETPTIQWVQAVAHPNQRPIRYKWFRIRRRIYEKLWQYASFLGTEPAKGYVLYAQELIKAACAIKADLYIAHNLGALPAALKAAAKHKAASAFDAEDYHRGEYQEQLLSYHMAIAIEDKYLPLVNYISTASPLIGEAYRSHYPNNDVTVINNVFNKLFLQPYTPVPSKSLKLFWFSQTAGPNRGLEIVVEAMKQLPDCNIELHILGNCSEEYRQQLSGSANRSSSIKFLSPVALKDIFTIAKNYDVGLVSDIPYCLNRELCLTNKLFTYLLAGNCIVASDTKAQQQFLHQHPGIGVVYKSLDPRHLAVQLKHLYDNREYLSSCRKKAHELADTVMNWENESKKLLSIVEKQLANS